MIIEGKVTVEFAFPDPPKSDAATPEERKAENLFRHAIYALDDFYKFPHAKLMETFGLENRMEQMMFMLPYLADYYEVTRDELLESWTQNLGMMHLYKS